MDLTDSPLRRAVRASDPEAVAAAIAADARPGHSGPDPRAALDRLAARLAPRLEGVRGPARLGRLLDGAYRELGFASPERYDDPDAHLLDRVLATRRGSPVVLAVVLGALGRRLDVTLHGVAFPGHYMVRYEAARPLFIDPASGAFPFPAESLLELAADELRLSPGAAKRFLEPASARSLAVRMLMNLQRAHELRGDLGRAMLAVDRLYELTGAPSLRCDRGLRAAALGAPYGALDDLRAFLREGHDAAAARAVARLDPTPLDLN